ncbi:MAG: Histone acetyltransferase, ELP3 family [Candidatus Parvarchaeum acidophilus ARMAN-5_'5-way FS']|jgi:elongator complex protein 3|uniref:tRNA carboxymethyluridine synthase n=2 Tax=Parvarchaeum acidophilus TaxID=662761 RepID=D6GWE5_PARA5|nr:MAG: histone acetyltransferase, ELP3 family [Candidatus Parvarchaeum acidophilus ARMAN-5]EGD71979.1 MAG: Histone acetyltransferase, ELP3 family [Candidatus Parvarchaeum acidophilus ARMAN-5_'5-way FS']
MDYYKNREKLKDFMPLFIERMNNENIENKKEMLILKRKVCRDIGMQDIPKDGEILNSFKLEDREKYSKLFLSKPIRILSGVNVVALMTKPYDCPHGTCIFCPGGTKFNTPQSYTGFEPAARRALINNYDPYKQVNARLSHYLFMGYSPQKIEVIIIGGTFTTLPKDYVLKYITEIYRAMNEFNGEKVEGALEQQQKFNETASVRCVAFAAETKPERCSNEDIERMLNFGITRVEMGVQSVYDEVLLRNNRGHTIHDVIDSTRRLKNYGYKVDHHIMLNLPFSDFDKDKETINQIYTNEDFKPDAIKLYPTLVIRGTGLYEMSKKGKYNPYPKEDVIKLITEAEINAPRWLRIMRIERDIPSTFIDKGIKTTNLRQEVEESLVQKGKRSNDIRSREIGHTRISKPIKIELKRENYRASRGDEIFLSFEDVNNDALIAFLRLRIADDSNAAFVRELHVYGEELNINGKSDTAFQHKGFGKTLLAEAERISRYEYSINRINVISGVGVREYYRSLGYSRYKWYMSKEI